MYVIGAGKTKFGVLRRSIEELIYEAIVLALDDSGKSISDIDAMYVSNFCSGPFEKQLHLNSLVSSMIKRDIPIVRIEAACASGGAAINQAIHMANKLDNIMVIGVERMTGVDTAKATENISMAGSRRLDQMNGLIFPGGYALIAQNYIHKYGANIDDLSLVSLKNHRNGKTNKLAHFYGKTVTMDDIKNSPIVSSPLRLYDCSPISDGAAAIIISKEKSSDRNVKILASSLRTGPLSISDAVNITSFDAAVKAAREAYKMAGIQPGDVDLAEVHDCFTIAELIAMEDLSFCGRGEAKDMIRDHITDIGSRLPVNPSGGLKAGGHPIGATGVSQVYEIVRQLRGEAGENQVGDPTIGLTHNIGGTGGTAAIHILERL